MNDSAKWALVALGAILLISGIVLIGLGASEFSNLGSNQCFPGVLGCSYTFTCNGSNANCSNITYILQQQQQQQLQQQLNPLQTFQQQSNAMFGAWATLVIGIILAPVGFIMLIVGALYNPAKSLLMGNVPLSTASQERVYCKNCGFENLVSPGDRFCRNCGSALST